MKLNSKSKFKNVYLFVSDALRYPTDNGLFQGKKVVKTVSSSPMSASSYPTIISGLYPPEHGIDSFEKVLSPNIPTLFDLFSNTTPCHNCTASLLDQDGVKPYSSYDLFLSAIQDIESPFIAFDRDTITHTPYGYDVTGTEYDNANVGFSTDAEYWETRKNDIQEIRNDYEAGIERSVERFKQRVDILRQRGLLESTLVIFTSDHGELLGEHGFYGHGDILVPEVIYVPTVFYNESISVNGEFMGLIDLFPTIAALLDSPVDDHVSGKDLTKGVPEDRLIYSDNEYVDNNISEWSMWSKKGGYTYSESNWLMSIYNTVGNMTTRGNSAKIQRKHPMKVIATEFKRKSGRTFGKPISTRTQARKKGKDIRDRSEDALTTEIDTDVKERLAKLGYRR